MDNKELIEKLKALKIKSMCRKTSKDEVYRTIYNLCEQRVYGGLAYLFAPFYDAEKILNQVQNMLYCYPLNEAWEVLMGVAGLVSDFGKTGDVESYFYAEDEEDYVRQLTVEDLKKLRDDIVDRLETLERS